MMLLTFASAFSLYLLLVIFSCFFLAQIVKICKSYASLEASIRSCHAADVRVTSEVTSILENLKRTKQELVNIIPKHRTERIASAKVSIGKACFSFLMLCINSTFFERQEMNVRDNFKQCFPELYVLLTGSQMQVLINAEQVSSGKEKNVETYMLLQDELNEHKNRSKGRIRQWEKENTALAVFDIETDIRSIAMNQQLLLAIAQCIDRIKLLKNAIARCEEPITQLQLHLPLFEREIFKLRNHLRDRDDRSNMQHNMEIHVDIAWQIEAKCTKKMQTLKNLESLALTQMRSLDTYKRFTNAFVWNLLKHFFCYYDLPRKRDEAGIIEDNLPNKSSLRDTVGTYLRRLWPRFSFHPYLRLPLLFFFAGVLMKAYVQRVWRMFVIVVVVAMALWGHATLYCFLFTCFIGSRILAFFINEREYLTASSLTRESSILLSYELLMIVFMSSMASWKVLMFYKSQISKNEAVNSEDDPRGFIINSSTKIVNDRIKSTVLTTSNFAILLWIFGCFSMFMISNGANIIWIAFGSYGYMTSYITTITCIVFAILIFSISMRRTERLLQQRLYHTFTLVQNYGAQFKEQLLALWLDDTKASIVETNEHVRNRCKRWVLSIWNSLHNKADNGTNTKLTVAVQYILIDVLLFYVPLCFGIFTQVRHFLFLCLFPLGIVFAISMVLLTFALLFFYRQVFYWQRRGPFWHHAVYFFYFLGSCFTKNGSHAHRM